MNSNQAMLQQTLTDNLSSKFLKEFSRRMPTIYKEAISRSTDEAVDEALKPYYFGQTRYTLVQSLFLEVGRECGHQTNIVLCEQNGFPIPVVSMGKFDFTVHYAYDAEDMSAIKPSFVRQQHCEINEKIIQGDLFDVEPNIGDLSFAEKIYANILFGCNADDKDFSTSGFLRIVVPYLEKNKIKSNKVRYIQNYNYNDILSRVIEKEKLVQEQRIMPNIAIPKIKNLKIG